MRRVPVHPAAWWAWALALGSMALVTSNPLLLIALGLVAATVGTLRRSPTGSQAALGSFLVLGAWVVGIRVAFQVVFGLRLPGHVLVALPQLQLPSWLAGVSLGGAVTAESLLAATVAGLKLAVALVAFGAANAVASPRELVRILPQSLAALSTAISVALAFVPSLLVGIAEQREARLLRGRPVRGFAGWRAMAIPALEGSLRSSTALAASMAARGYGGQGLSEARVPAPLLSLGLLGLGAATAGSYLLAYPTVPAAAAASLASLGLAAMGAVVVLGARKVARTRYRPAPFGLSSLATLATAAMVVAGVLTARVVEPTSVSWNPYSWTAPTLGWLAMASALLALAPLAWSDQELVR